MADETPEEKAALAKLGEATREVAWQEEQKEADRELSTGLFGAWLGAPGPAGWLFGRFRPFRRIKGNPVPEPVEDPDPVDERGLRHTLDDDEKS